MVEVGSFEAESALGPLLDRVQDGEEIVITRHGKAVARLIPATGVIDQDAARAAIDRIRARASQLSSAAFDWESLKQDRDAGRP